MPTPLKVKGNRKIAQKRGKKERALSQLKMKVHRMSHLDAGHGFFCIYRG